MYKDHDYLFKFIVIGDSSVGKTALLRRFAENYFASDTGATVGIDFKTKKIKIDGKNILLMIFDTAGGDIISCLNTAIVNDV
jgi:small GTP-binding protein